MKACPADRASASVVTVCARVRAFDPPARRHQGLSNASATVADGARLATSPIATVALPHCRAQTLAARRAPDRSTKVAVTLPAIMNKPKLSMACAKPRLNVSPMDGSVMRARIAKNCVPSSSEIKKGSCARDESTRMSKTVPQRTAA